MAHTTSPTLLRTFLKFLGPMILSNFLQGFSGTLNSIFAGQLLGKSAMAVVSGFFPIIFFLISLVIGLSIGATILLGQAWGAKKHDVVKHIMGSFLTVVVGLSLIMVPLWLLLIDDLLRLLNIPADIFADATIYAHWMMLNVPGIFVFILMTSLLRGVGDSVTPLRVLVLNTVMSFCLTPLFIYLGFGISSPAISGFLTFIISLGWLFWYLRYRFHPLMIDHAFMPYFRIRWSLVRQGVRLGVPTALQMVIVALSELVLVSFINTHGSDATAANGAVNQIIAYVQFPAISIAISVSILGSQAIGRGQVELLWPITRMGIYLNIIITGGLVVLALVMAGPVISLFVPDTTVVDLAKTMVLIMLWSLVLFGIARVFSAIMQASGDVLIPTGINIVCVIALEIPFAAWMNDSYGLVAIFWSYPLVYAAMLVVQIIYYQFVWCKQPIRRLI